MWKTWKNQYFNETHFWLLTDTVLSLANSQVWQIYSPEGLYLYCVVILGVGAQVLVAESLQQWFLWGLAEVALCQTQRVPVGANQSTSGHGCAKSGWWHCQENIIKSKQNAAQTVRNEWGKSKIRGTRLQKLKGKHGQRCCRCWTIGSSSALGEDNIRVDTYSAVCVRPCDVGGGYSSGVMAGHGIAMLV